MERRFTFEFGCVSVCTLWFVLVFTILAIGQTDGSNCTLYDMDGCTNCTLNPFCNVTCNCVNGGTCVKPGICKCPIGFGGHDCSRASPDSFYSPRFCGRGFRLIASDRFQVQPNATSAIQCADACNRVGRLNCRSFSYYPSNPPLCWLNRGHTNELWEGLEAASDWFYYHADSKEEGEMPCKNNTFRDCTIVARLGLPAGEYNFQTDVGSKPFRARCETLPGTTIINDWGPAPNTTNLMMTFFKRLEFNDLWFGNKTWADYKWGFSSSFNATRWIGLEWGYQLTSGDFALVVTSSPLFCIEMAPLNATTTYLVIKSETTVTNCAFFTHRKGRLMIATRSTCLCDDPATTYVILCGCNTPFQRKFYYNSIDKAVYQVSSPLSVGVNYQWSLGDLSSGIPITLVPAGTTVVTFSPKQSRWDIVIGCQQFPPTNNPIYHTATYPRGALKDESLGYMIFVPDYATTSSSINPVNMSPRNNSLMTQFVTADHPVRSTTYGGGWWMVDGTLGSDATQMCLTCTTSMAYYRMKATVLVCSDSFVMMAPRPEGG